MAIIPTYIYINSELQCASNDNFSLNLFHYNLYQTLDEDTYTEWLKDHRLAEDAVTERGSLLYESACRMETDLTLLGKYLLGILP